MVAAGIVIHGSSVLRYLELTLAGADWGVCPPRLPQWSAKSEMLNRADLSSHDPGSRLQSGIVWLATVSGEPVLGAELQPWRAALHAVR